MKSILLFIAILSCLTSCATQKRNMAYQNEPIATATSKVDVTYTPEASISEINQAKKVEDIETESTTEEDRKVIYDTTLRVEVDSLYNQPAEVMKIVDAYKGYVVYSSNDYAKIRIPSLMMNSAIEDLKTLGRTYQETITGRDVTDQYYDIKTRLESTEATRRRYLELLNKATTVDEILKVERELERLNIVIESYKGQLKQLDELESFATITVYFTLKTKPIQYTQSPQYKPGPVGYVFVGIYKAVKWLFVREVKTPVVE